MLLCSIYLFYVTLHIVLLPQCSLQHSIPISKLKRVKKHVHQPEPNALYYGIQILATLLFLRYLYGYDRVVFTKNQRPFFSKMNIKKGLYPSGIKQKNGGGGGNRTHVRNKAASATTCVVSDLQPKSVLRPTDIERLRIRYYLSSHHLTQNKASGLSW